MTQQVGGRKLEKRLTNKKREKAQNINAFVTEYLALCKKTGYMMFATLKNADPDGTQFAIQYKVRQYKDENVNVPDSVKLQDELVELEQTGKITKDSEEYLAKVKVIDEAKAKELQAVLDSLPTEYADDEEREIRHQTATKIVELLILSGSDKNAMLTTVNQYVNSLYEPEVVAKPLEKETVATEETVAA